MGAEPFSLSLESMGIQAVLAFAFAFLWERLWANLMPRRISAGRHLDFHLKVGFPLVVLVRFLCAPFRFVVNLLEKSILSISPATEENSTDSTEVADHIRTLGMESSNMDPEVVEIVGNTLEMSHLKRSGRNGSEKPSSGSR